MVATISLVEKIRASMARRRMAKGKDRYTVTEYSHLLPNIDGVLQAVICITALLEEAADVIKL